MKNMKLTQKQQQLKKALQPIVESILKEAQQPFDVASILKSSFPGFKFTFISENPRYNSIELNIIPDNEQDSQWLSKNKDKFTSILKNPNFETKLLQAYNKKTNNEWDYIDDLNGTIKSIHSGMY